MLPLAEVGALPSSRSVHKESGIGEGISHIDVVVLLLAVCIMSALDVLSLSFAPLRTF